MLLSQKVDKNNFYIKQILDICNSKQDDIFTIPEAKIIKTCLIGLLVNGYTKEHIYILFPQLIEKGFFIEYE